MQQKILDFLITSNAKFTLGMTVLFSVQTGMVGMYCLEHPTPDAAIGVALGMLITGMYAILSYFTIRNELMDQLMAKLSSKEQDNDSNRIDA